MSKNARRWALIIGFIVCVYAAGRLYFYLTAGFTEGNIASDFAFQPHWEVRPLQPPEEREVNIALDQPYDYLGKGCQSYVFASRDGKYVLKFFKHQRYRLAPWLTYFPPLPAIVRYRQEKSAKKWRKFDRFAQSWKIAFEHLKEETGLIYVHLNQTEHIKRPIWIHDKLGLIHRVELDRVSFCLQRRGELLCDALSRLRARGDLVAAKALVSALLRLILSAYAQGLADHDHALMQNTGVIEGRPVHIDVGQFAWNAAVQTPAGRHQELFDKTYKFKRWLDSQYPELGAYLEGELQALIGPGYDAMQPTPHFHD